METAVEILLTVLGAYLLMGLLFAVPFAFFGARAFDPSAVQGTLGFKLIIIPGAALLWPLMAKRWISRTQPTESTAHRKSAGTKPDLETEQA